MAKEHSADRKNSSKARRRVAIVGGLRTPFVKAGTAFKKVGAVELSRQLLTELVARSPVAAKDIDRLVFGQVVGHPTIPNVAREVGLAAGLPFTMDAYTVARACATGTQALVEATMAILCGDIDTAIVGGVEALSRPPMTYQDAVVDALMAANAAKSPLEKARALLKVRPKDLLPVPPALKEPSTGLLMGESAEKMAKENGIARAAQDGVALRSHQRAAKAWADGIYDDEVMAVLAPGKGGPEAVSRDGMVRADVQADKLAALKPVFDRKHGTISAGNSSPLTDGAAALLLMDADKAHALGIEPLAYVSSWAFAAVEPGGQLLAAPALAIPQALARAGTSMAELTYVDLHEAFGAQVLSNLQHLESEGWQQRHCGLAAQAHVDPETINAFGGSIALGHPFAATGARQVLTMARALQRKGGGKALVSQCAAGGLAGACVIER
jgi:acetyl-CoA acyltransferase